MARTVARILSSFLAVTLAATAVAAATPAAAASEGDQLDLVLLLDGSGSISGADWSLQLEGYAAALSDRVNFPTDGSVAVSVIQWSDSGWEYTRLEVPLTVLDSRATVDSVVAGVLAIQQIGQNTNPGDAVIAGAAELVERGRPGASGVLCMSTDGTRNAGHRLASATAQARDEGVDKYSVVAIADGSFTEATAMAAYGPWVFGGGTVTFARSTAEFTTLIAGCVADALNLVALEVTQSVQDLDNSVPLVEGKDTLVRAYLGTVDGETVRATARLRGYANGLELDQSPLTPINSATGILVDGDALADRADPTRTLNFLLPDVWTSEDEIELVLEYPGGLVCVGQSEANPLCTETVTFGDAIPLDVNYVSVGWEENDTRVERTFEDLEELAARVRSELPIGHEYREGFQYGYIRVAERPTNLSQVNERLASARRIEGAPAEQRWYGVLAGADESDTPEGGRAAGRVASGWDGDLNEERAFGYARNRVVHEIGHTLGLDHSVNAEENGYETFLGFRTDKRGWCDETAALSAPDYPYWRPVGEESVAALGPMGSVRGQVWGTDLRFFGDYTPLALSDPAGTTSLMSYCSAEDQTSQQRWISAYDYQRLLTEDLSPIDGGGTEDASGSGALVRGVIMADGTATFSPVLPIDAAPTVDDPEGTHEIALLDAAGVALHTVRFTPVESDGDAEEGDADEPGDWIVGVVVPTGLGGAASVELRQDGEVLAATQVSAAAPVATITAPTTGTSEEVTFTWSAADADGDALTHTLLYSADDGLTWTVVAIDLTDQSVSIPRWALPGTDAARVRVISSDGANTTTATSESFTMPDLPPTITIVSPADGTEIAGAQTVAFSAEASDPEDGSGIVSGVVWESDLDGHLGSGATFQLRADQLSEGTHHITATVADSASQAASATVVLTIRRVAGTPLEDPPTCAVRYTVHGDWPTGFTSQIWIRNIGTDLIDGWELEWEMPAGQSVAYLWGSTVTIEGAVVTATNLSWNAGILPGQEITIGFTGAKPTDEAAAVPTWFRLNGGACE